MQYSLFGKELRKLIIDQDLKVYDLAKKLGVSSAFISSLMTGKKNVPENFIDQIIPILIIDNDEVLKLKKLSEMSKDVYKVDLSKSNNLARETMFTFQRNLNDLTDEDLIEIKQILEKSRNDD